MPPLPSAAPGQVLRSNFRNLYFDVVWYGVLAGSAIGFLSVYAAHLGASGFQVGLLTAGPGAVNLIFSLPSGRWLENRPLSHTTFRSSILHRFAYLLLIPLPWLLGPRPQVWAIIALTVAMSIPGTLMAIAFNALLADVVPPDWRGHVVGRRNALLAVSLMGTSLLCGWLLESIVFPTNYIAVFGLGALGAALSTYHLGRLRPLAEKPLRVGGPLDEAARPGLLRFADTLREAAGLRFLTRSGGRPLLRLDLITGPFGPFMAAFLFFYTIQFVPVPIFPLFWVQDLHLSDGAISVGNALFYAGMTLASLQLRKLSARWGHRGVLVVGALLYGLYPLLTGFAQGPPLYWTASLVGGAVWGVLNGGLLNRLMERVPEDDRPAHMALHNLVMNLGILSGSLLGPLLAQGLGLRQSLFLAGGLRLAAGIVFSFLG